MSLMHVLLMSTNGESLSLLRWLSAREVIRIHPASDPGCGSPAPPRIRKGSGLEIVFVLDDSH